MKRREQSQTANLQFPTGEEFQKCIKEGDPNFPSASMSTSNINLRQQETEMLSQNSQLDGILDCDSESKNNMFFIKLIQTR